MDFIAKYYTESRLKKDLDELSAKDRLSWLEKLWSFALKLETHSSSATPSVCKEPRSKEPRVKESLAMEDGAGGIEGKEGHAGMSVDTCIQRMALLLSEREKD